MAEHPKMGELVDHDRLERFRWGKDEPPRERQAAAFGGAPPATPLITDADRGGRHVHVRGVPTDLALDLAPGPRFEPGFEDRPDGTSVRRCEANDDLVLVAPADALHARPPSPRIGGVDAEPMELAPEAHERAVAEAPAGGQLGSVTGMPFEMAPQPRLSLHEERANAALRIRPAAAPVRWNRDHDPAVGMDDDAKPA